MQDLWIIVSVILAIGWLSFKGWRWKSNYSQALSTGLPVFFSPVHMTSIWWLLFGRFLVPIFQCLPRNWTAPWLEMAQLRLIWKYSYSPFKEVGNDTFILATPKENILWTCDMAVMDQLLTQPDKCQKPKETAPGVWGPNVIYTEGEEWKKHRKVISAGLGTSINPIVWAESQHHTASLIETWIEDGSVIKDMKPWMSNLALHVISEGFFGKRLTWKESVDAAPAGHQLSFEKALFTVLNKFTLIYLTPWKILSKLPFKYCRDAYLGVTECTTYLQEIQAGVVDHLEEIEAKKKKTLLEIIVTTGHSGTISQGSVMANMFMSLAAGHESTGNLMGFLMILLAIYPEYQRQMQDELDRQLGNRPRDEWTVTQDYAVLQNGIIGAIQKESLRLYHPVRYFKRVTIAPITIVDSKGSTHLIPKNTAILLNIAAASKHPTVWTQRNMSTERRAQLHYSPALDFDPLRWMEGDPKVMESQYWTPFGHGPRYCPGKAFAQVEMTAIMATLFKDYSLELVVDDTYHDDAKLAWEKTRDHAIQMLYDNVDAGLTVFMAKELPLRIVPRSSTP